MCLSKSPNKHNRLFLKANPIAEDLTNMIEKEEVGPKTESKEETAGDKVE
jgi:elongation factor 2